MLQLADKSVCLSVVGLFIVSKRPSVEINRSSTSHISFSFVDIILHLWLVLPSDLSGQNSIPLEKKTASLGSVFRGAHYIRIQGEQPLK